MQLSRLRLGELIAGAAGVGLAIVIFLPWYGPQPGFGGVVPDEAQAFSAWEQFMFIDKVLLLTAATAIVAAVLAAQQQSVAVPVAASVVVTALGALATLLVLYRLVNEPSASNDLTNVTWGAWLGLALCALVTLGGFLAMRDEGTSPAAPGAGTAAAAASDVPVRPAPPAAAPGSAEPGPRSGGPPPGGHA